MAEVLEPFYVTAKENEEKAVDFSLAPGAMRKQVDSSVAHGDPGNCAVLSLRPGTSRQNSEARIQLMREELLVLGERLLFVDDEESMVFLMKRWLERLGYKVTGCTVPEEALEIFRCGPQDFDLVLSDFSMPQMCGVDFARELLRIRPDMPIFITSGYIGPAEEEQVRTLGLPQMLPKPRTFEELAQTLYMALSKFKSCDPRKESPLDSEPGRMAAASGG